jgi:hypothetical protein
MRLRCLLLPHRSMLDSIIVRDDCSLHCAIVAACRSSDQRRRWVRAPALISVRDRAA